MKFASYMADMGVREGGMLLWLGSLEEGDHGEQIDVDEMKRLKLIFKKNYGRVWNGFIRIRVGTSGDIFK